VLSSAVTDRLERLLKEQIQVKKNRSFGLSPRKKILLLSKEDELGFSLLVMQTASALAGELGIPLFVVRLDDFVTKFTAETQDKLQIVFDAIAKLRGVYLFDKIDSIVSQSELNSFLKMVKQDNSNSLIIAATSKIQVLDDDSFSIFDDVIEYQPIEFQQIVNLLKNKLSLIDTSCMKDGNWDDLASFVKGLSYNIIMKGCEEVIKDSIINNKEKVTAIDLLNTFGKHYQRKPVK
jgi:AAA+ superfamily predicted ATPase